MKLSFKYKTLADTAKRLVVFTSSSHFTDALKQYFDNFLNSQKLIILHKTLRLSSGILQNQADLVIIDTDKIDAELMGVVDQLPVRVLFYKGYLMRDQESFIRLAEKMLGFKPD